MRVTSILFLDDSRDTAVNVAQHPAVSRRSFQRRREEGQRRFAAAMLLDHGAQGFFSDQRHVAAKNQQVAREIRKGRLGAENSMTGSELHFLNRPGHIFTAISLAHRLRAMTDDNRNARRRQPLRRGQGMKKKRPSGEPMKHLGQRGFHPAALSSRQKNDSKFLHVPQFKATTLNYRVTSGSIKAKI